MCDTMWNQRNNLCCLRMMSTSSLFSPISTHVPYTLPHRFILAWIRYAERATLVDSIIILIMRRTRSLQRYGRLQDSSEPLFVVRSFEPSLPLPTHWRWLFVCHRRSRQHRSRYRSPTEFFFWPCQWRVFCRRSVAHHDNRHGCNWRLSRPARFPQQSPAT